jgi:4-amino-4-deoxy-L-arabinose transferase-like glycosyltransferase
MLKNKWLLLGAIVLLAGILRLTGLAAYPAGFTPDEAAFGYNAYSLLLTGKDEWGIPFWQLPYDNLRSFGDYKMPLYAFMAVPSVAAYGLNEFSVRLPDAVIGTLAVVVVFILCRFLKLSHSVSLLSSLLLALSPWAVPLSRGAFEANLITFFLPLGLCLFFCRRYSLSAVICSLTLYSYHSARVIVPLALLGLYLIYRPRLNRLITKSLIILVILCIPVGYSLAFSNSRAVDVSIFRPDDNWASIARLMINKISHTSLVFLHNYLSYFSFRFLFVSGPGEATYGMLPGNGVLYAIQLPFLLIFLYLIISSKNKFYYYLLLLLLISPIPAAMTKGPGFAANRTAFMLIPLSIMTIVGFVKTLDLAASRTFRHLITILAFLLTVSAFGMYINRYLKTSPLVHPGAMGYGWQPVVDYLKRVNRDYPAIRISRSLSEPHIFLAFYDRIPPWIYQLSSTGWPDFRKLGFSFLDQYDGYTLGKYRFGDLQFSEKIDSPVLYVGRPSDIPDTVKPLFVSFYPNGTPAIIVAGQTPAGSRLGFRP